MDTLKQKSVDTQEKSLFSLLANFGFTKEQLQPVSNDPGFRKRVEFVIGTPDVSTERKKKGIEKILTQYVNNITIKQNLKKAIEVAEKTPETVKATSKQKRKSNGPRTTIKNMKTLAVIAEEGLSIQEIAEKTGLCIRGLRDALNKMCDQKFVTFRVVEHGKKIWKNTLAGNIKLHNYGMQFNIYDIPNKSGNTYILNCTPTPQMFLLQIELLEQNRNELLKLGFFRTFIPKIFKKFSPSYIKEKIDYVKSRTDLENPGAFLNSLFHPKQNQEARVKGLVKKVLTSLSQEVKELFLHLTREITLKQSFHLAYSLRKIHDKNYFVAVSDVHGVLNWIRKRALGTTIQRC